MTGDAEDGPLAHLVERFTTSLRSAGPYRPPLPAEDAVVDRLVLAVLAACAGADTADLGPAARAAGFAVRRVGGRTLLVADPTTPRAWGLVVLPAVVGGRAPQVVVEIPHPHSDLRTERVGLGVLGRLDGALLLQAGAHRHAAAPAGARRRADFPADVSHRPDSVFARLAAGLVGAHGTPQVQVHGCADRPGFDVVASPGAGSSSALLGEVTRGLRAAGERVRGGGEPGCERLSGTRNVQGGLAARLGTPFVHLELSRSLRADPARRAAVSAVVAEAVAATDGGDVRDGSYHRFA
ncbi:MAG TPA: hypothetical protein VGH76_21990 [Actinomycetospora sp.]|uniref:hypothetical protein n=1 Tax=Actinomycetospora sp. TaxID=1872135 RepID=UPI002F42CA14